MTEPDRPPPPGPPDQPEASVESQAFVMRMRLEQGPFAPDRPRQAAGRPRLHIRVEHVNRADVSQHQSIDSALGWLRHRMSALLSRSFPPDPGAPMPPSDKP